MRSSAGSSAPPRANWPAIDGGQPIAIPYFGASNAVGRGAATLTSIGTSEADTTRGNWSAFSNKDIRGGSTDAVSSSASEGTGIAN